MQTANRDVKTAYMQKAARNTRKSGRLLALFSLPYTAITAIYEFTIKQNLVALGLRLSACLALTFFLLITKFRPKLNYKKIISFYLITLSVLCIEICGLTITDFEDHFVVYAMAFSIIRLISSALLLYFFSAGVRPYLHYLLALPTIFIIVYTTFVQQVDSETLSLLVNPVIVILAIIIYNRWETRKQLREFVNIRQTEHQKTQLETRFKEQRQKALKLENQATRDELTGLFNRRFAFATLGQLLESSVYSQTPITICFIDVDQLKLANDTKGHAAGDKLLRKLACCLREHIRSSDYICRLGGDEFLVIFPGCPLTKAQSIIKTIHQDLITNHQIDFSYGFAAYPQDTEANPHTLVNIADQNMYQNKVKKQKTRNTANNEHQLPQ